MVAAERASSTEGLLGGAGDVAVEDPVRQEVYVDRARLECMMSGGDENLEPADVFFKRIMLETNTRIIWPTQLKIGGKTRRMPRIHFSGEVNNVMEAVCQVRSVLTAPDERVTLKLDVSHAFHSHIIGRGGAQVQTLMRETGAHVHFPDCNRSAGPTTQRSNFVSATGPLGAVELARQKLREMMPVVFYMDVNLSGRAFSSQSLAANVAPGAMVAAVLSTAAVPCQAALATTLAMAATAQKNYAVSVRARMRGIGGGIVQLQIRGADKDLPRLRTACAALARELCDRGGIEGTTEVYTTVQISPRHQTVVLGPGNQWMVRIAENTGAQLSVADINDDTVAPARRGAVTLAGTLDAVYQARQQLIGSLPLKLVFDIPEHMVVRNSTVLHLSNMLDVNISTFHKEKQHCITVTIRGVERNATNLYEARRLLLGSHITPVLASIPVAYHIPMKNATHPYNGRYLSAGNLPVPCRAIDMFPNCPSTSNSDESSPNVSPLKNACAFPLGNSASSNPMVSPDKMPSRCSVADNTSPSLSPMKTPPRHAVPPQGNLASLQVTAALQGMKASSNVMQVAWPEKFNKPPCPSQLFSARENHGMNLQAPPTAARPTAARPTAAPTIAAPTIAAPTIAAPSIAAPSIAAPPTNSGFNFSTTPNMNGDKFQRMEAMLMCLGLEKYIGLFRNEEIDFGVFQTLNEQDFLNIGITAYGTRRKLIGVINSFKKNEVTYSGSAAPGAERKPSPPDTTKRHHYLQ